MVKAEQEPGLDPAPSPGKLQHQPGVTAWLPWLSGGPSSAGIRDQFIQGDPRTAVGSSGTPWEPQACWHRGQGVPGPKGTWLPQTSVPQSPTCLHFRESPRCQASRIPPGIPTFAGLLQSAPEHKPCQAPQAPLNEVAIVTGASRQPRSSLK